MRRTRTAVACLLAPALLVATGCSGDPEPGAQTSPRPSAPSSPMPTETSGEPLPADTWADVEDPATMEVPLDMVEGVAEVRVWDGSRFQRNPTAIVVGNRVSRTGIRLVTVAWTDNGKDTSEAQIRYEINHDTRSDEPPTLLEPVVVDGREMQHARGEDVVRVTDTFVYADGGDAVLVIFTTPQELTDAEREESIGQVMATLRWS